MCVRISVFLPGCLCCVSVSVCVSACVCVMLMLQLENSVLVSFKTDIIIVFNHANLYIVYTALIQVDEL